MLKHDWFRVALGMFLVAFGANLFAPMVITYQVHTTLGMVQTSFLFGVYAIGIMVALFFGGPASDTLGRRAVMRPALVATLTGSLILILGRNGAMLPLLAGRLMIGLAVGLAMSSGAAWIKELSAHVHVGAQRSSIALSAGFSLAPGIAGLIAQYLVAPTVLPYLAHIALALGIIPLVWTAPARPAAGRGGSWIPRSLLTRDYLHVVAYAPWVFGSASTCFVFLPNFLSEHLVHPIAIAGFTALLGMGSGVGMQQLAGRFHLTSTMGMVLATVGMGLCFALTFFREHNWTIMFLPVGALIMGSAYGILMLRGLAETQTMSAPDELGAATGVFYSLTYLGFFAPFILSSLGPAVGFGTTFVVGSVVAGVTAVWLHRVERTTGRGNQG